MRKNTSAMKAKISNAWISPIPAGG